MHARATVSRHGATATEMLIGVVIVTTMLALASTGFVKLVHGANRSSVQAELDMDVRKSIEMLRENLRLTSVDRILLYPQGAGPYTAISFPAASANTSGMVDLAPGGTNIVWDQTIIYHVWAGTPSRLLRTTFRPRVNTLSDANRIEQLRLVVVNADHGRSFAAERYQDTRVVFKNLFVWQLTTNTRPFNGYDSYLHPEEFAFGSAILSPGNHTLQFRTLAAGAGGGYKIGLDVLRASASGSDREAEEQTYVAGGGATARNDDYQSSGAWSGNKQLVLDATRSNQTLSVTLRNDEWEDSNFDVGGTFDRTAVSFVDADKDNELTLGGKGIAWLASQQTRADMAASTNDLRGYVVRVLVHGSAMPDGGAILQNGSFVNRSDYTEETSCLVFRVPPGMDRFDLDRAYIARVNGTNYTAEIDTSASSLRRLKLRQGMDGNIYGYYDRDLYPTLYDFSRTNTYAVTFWVAPGGSIGNLPAWVEQDADAPGCYVVPAEDILTARSLMVQSWPSSMPGLAIHRELYALEKVVTGYASSGTFLSQVFDTGKDTPQYDTTTWESVVPSGASLALAFRSGSTRDLAAVAWSTAVGSGSAPLGMGSGRYVQYQVSLRPDATAQQTPRLKRVRLGWPGDVKIVGISGIATRGPDYGIYEVSVDNTPLVRSVRIDLTIFKDVMSKSYSKQRITSTMLAEVEPRNTGK